jgi:hypothetical protein
MSTEMLSIELYNCVPDNLKLTEKEKLNSTVQELQFMLAHGNTLVNSVKILSDITGIKWYTITREYFKTIGVL